MSKRPATMYFLVLLFSCLFTIMAMIPQGMVSAEEEEVRDYDTLKGEMNAALEARNYDTALDLARKINESVESKHWEALYEIASIYLLKGDISKAYRYLDLAVRAGYWDAQNMKKDSRFDGIREEPRYKELTREAWANGYIYMLERDEREEFQRTEEVMNTLAFKPGERVADVGAGSGYFTVRVAKAVGPEGKVLAIDLFDVMLDYIDRRCRAEQLDNVELQKVERDDPNLPPKGIDTILMVDTYHYIQDRTEYAKKLRSGLAPGGRLVVIDFIPKSWEERPWGPPPEQHLSKETLSADLAGAGFKVIEEHDFMPEHFFVIYGIE